MSLAEDRTRLSFAEIERVLRFSLPNSARRYAPWWANTGGSHIQADAWISAGWRTAQVDVAGEQVTFERSTREPPGPVPAIGPAEAGSGVRDSSVPFMRDDVITITKTALRGGAIRLLEDYCEENGGTLADAVAAILNGMALERRRQLVERFKAISPRLTDDSTDIIRADRDAR
jgi:hypothetical protein